MSWQYWGGPLDGGTVEDYLTHREAIITSDGRSDQSSVVYIYVKCESCHTFEFFGDVDYEDS